MCYNSNGDYAEVMSCGQWKPERHFPPLFYLAQGKNSGKHMSRLIFYHKKETDFSGSFCITPSQTAAARAVRKHFQKNKMRAKILKRDGKRCRICGADWCLQVHHIKPIWLAVIEEITRRDCKDYHEFYALDRELSKSGDFAQRLNSPANLITLCDDCHKKQHEAKTQAEVEKKHRVVFSKHNLQRMSQLSGQRLK